MLDNMKTISSQYRDNEPVDFKRLTKRLNDLENEEFLTLSDKNQENFIQVAFDNDENFVYLIEMRLYQGENFTHYRTFCNDFEQVITYFSQFYADNFDFDFGVWQDVTAEFLQTLTLDTRLGGECYDGCIATLDSVMDDVGLFAELAVVGDFVHIFTDELENRQSLVIYPNFEQPTLRYDVKFKNSTTETPVTTYDNLAEIEKVVQDFLAKYTNN